MINKLKLKYTQTVGERSEIDDVTSILLLIERFYGHQVLDPEWSWKKYSFHQIFCFLILIYLSFGTYEVLNKPDISINMFAEGVYTFLLIVINPLKLLIFISKRDDFKKLYLIIKTDFYDLIKQVMNDKVNEILDTIKLKLVVFSSLMAAPVVAYEFVTFWGYLNGDRKWMSRTSDILMPMTSPYFEIGWFLHSFFMSYIAAILMIMDIWFVFFCSFYGFACDCLVIVLNVDKKRTDENTDEYADRLSCSLRNFYNHHLSIVRFLRILNRMYKWLALVPLSNAALSICIILMVLQEGINLKFTPQILPIVGTVFMFGYYGERLKEKTDQIQGALLNFDWINMNLKGKRDYYTIVLFMANEFGITTAIGHDLCHVTMSTVAKFSYQAFTVLQTTN